MSGSNVKRTASDKKRQQEWTLSSDSGRGASERGAVGVMGLEYARAGPGTAKLSEHHHGALLHQVDTDRREGEVKRRAGWNGHRLIVACPCG